MVCAERRSHHFCSRERGLRSSFHPGESGLISAALDTRRERGEPAVHVPFTEFLHQHPNVKLHFTPTYSSWLNQVEIWFGRIEREVIARGIFTSVKDLARKPMRYIQAYSVSAKPFRWKYANVHRRITC